MARMRAGCIVSALLVLTQVAAAALMLWVVAARLDSPARKYTFNAPPAACLLGAAPGGTSACRVAYAFTGVSLAASAALAALLVRACRVFGAGAAVDAVVALLGSALWATAAIALTSAAAGAERAGLPRGLQRQWAVLLCWCQVALFGAAFLTNLVRVYFKCRGAEAGAAGPVLPIKGCPAATRVNVSAAALYPAAGASAPFYAPPPPAAGVPLSYGARGPQPLVHSVRAPQLAGGAAGAAGSAAQFQTKDFGPDVYWGLAATRY